MKRIPLPWTTVIAFTTGANYRFIPTTGYYSGASVRLARGTFELISAQANLSVAFAYQTANVDGTVDAAVAIGTALTADGMSYGTVTDISANTASKQFVRFGFLCQNTQAASLVLGRAGGSVEFDD